MEYLQGVDKAEIANQIQKVIAEHLIILYKLIVYFFFYRKILII